MWKVAIFLSALIVSASSITFAATNPFSDVPANHWAYRSVAKLAAVGVIEGYGDKTFRGEKNITRYEMAQMIAKAMTKNLHGENKFELDKLIAEFRDELEALNIRVDNLEKHADKISMSGKIEHNFDEYKIDPLNTGHKTRTTYITSLLRLDPKIKLDEHLTIGARYEAWIDLLEDIAFSSPLVHAWAQGDHDDFRFKIGKFEFSPEAEDGIVFDTDISGAEFSFGSKWKFTATVGRLSGDQVQGGWNGIQLGDTANDLSYYAFGYDPSTILNLRVDYNFGGEKFFGGAGYYHIIDDDLAWSKRNFVDDFDGERLDDENYIAYTKSRMKNFNKADIWTINLGYKFTDKFSLQGSYARNTHADWEKNSWQVDLIYGNYNDASEKGQWSVATGYRKFGTNATLMGSIDNDTILGTRGYFIGLDWAPFKNFGVNIKFFRGKHLSDGTYNSGRGSAQKFFSGLELFF